MVDTNFPVLIEDGTDHSTGTIGGIGISAIMGVNPWVRPYDFWLQATGQAVPKQANAAMERGRLYEPVVAEMFGAANQNFVVRKNLNDSDTPCRVRDRRYEYITGSPDRILWKDGKPVAGLEIKTSSVFNRDQWGESGTNQIPKHYLAQCLHYMGLTGLREWYLAVLFLDENEPYGYRSFRLDYDDETWSAMREIAVSFWEKYVVPKVAPSLEMGFGQETIDYFKNLYRYDTKPIESANEEESALIGYLLDAKTEVELAEQRYETLKAQMMEKIGERSGVFSEVGKVTWKKPKDRETVDWKSIATELGADNEMIQRFTTTKETSRIFLVKPAKF